MKTQFRLIVLFIVGFCLQLHVVVAQAQTNPTEPQTMPISLAHPKPTKQTGLRRPQGDGNLWTFQIAPDSDVHWVEGPTWSYPGKGAGADPDWGQWGGGADGQMWVSWVSPQKAAPFTIKVTGKIVGTGTGPGGGGGGQPIDVEASWEGEVEFNASMTVQRKGPAPIPAMNSSAIVASGAISSDEHQAVVEVTATDMQGGLLSGVKIDAPAISGGDGVSIQGQSKDAVITPSNATTGANGKATFTYTSSNKIKNGVTLTLNSGQKNGTQTVTVNQHWNDLANPWIDLPEYFYYGQDASIKIGPKITDETGSVKITGHKLNFWLLNAHVWKWNGTTWVETTYTPFGPPDSSDANSTMTIKSQIVPDGQNPLDLVTFTPWARRTDSSGVYGSTLNAIYKPDEIVDLVKFYIEDDETFLNN